MSYLKIFFRLLIIIGFLLVIAHSPQEQSKTMKRLKEPYQHGKLRR